ncbi:MAG TPA: hypothetical protein VM597_25775 [Gemmataceae bacterium]|jgi:hypothetical protein|nr:hypothetical protein [Gemmataceae bacterium]
MNRRLLVFAALVIAPTAGRADHDALDTAFLKAAPEIISALKDAKSENVGVLKFRIQKGDGPASDSVGELNMGLADRLEAALILALPENEKFGILGRPSLTVLQEKNEAAGLKDADSRAAYFDGIYPLSWGDRHDAKKKGWVKPSAFIAGTAVINKALTEVTVTLQSFGPDGTLKDLGKPITVPMSRRTLVEAGYSYVLTQKNAPALFDGARGGKAKSEGVSQFKPVDEEVSLKNAVVINDAARPAAKAPALASLDECPVKLKITYNGEEMPIEKGEVREPKEGDRIVFTLENTDPDPKALYAVVLKVNGKNTIFSEDAEANYCLKWILEHGQKLEVKGFQVDSEHYNEFVVKSDKDSKAEADVYGDLAGTVRMVVFRGEHVTEDPSILEKKDVPLNTMVMNAISRGARGLDPKAIPPGSVAGLKGLLKNRQVQPEGQRGMIVKGDQVKKGNIEKIHFLTLPTVGVADITIRYYAPKK